MPRGGGRMSEYGIEARRRASSPALGASGAVNAVVIAQICLFPSSTILLYGILPMPSALFGLLWIASDIGGMLGVSYFLSPTSAAVECSDKCRLNSVCGFRADCKPNLT